MTISKERIQIFHLLYLTFMFMAVFQLVTRLTSYTFMFHQGVLLLSSALIGAGLGVLIAILFSAGLQKKLFVWSPTLLVFSFFTYCVIFVLSQNIAIHFVVLTLLYTVFFVRITNYIHISPNTFTTIDLTGSLLGVLALVGASQFFLEEILIIGVSAGLVLYSLLVTKEGNILRWCNRTAIVVFLGFIYTASYYSLPEIINCPNQSQTYKIACTTSAQSFQYIESVPNLKGRSDIFMQLNNTGDRLSVYNSGLHSGTSLVRDEYMHNVDIYHDVEIPQLAYKENSRVVAAGASTGSNVQTFQKYIPGADIVMVDIDDIILDLHSATKYGKFLPIQGSYVFKQQDARTFFVSDSTTYDVISMMVESVNTTEAPYVDESTSLVYTTEALRTYLDSLNPEGYLLLQQFHTADAAGGAMIHKVLASLESALGYRLASELENKLILYTYGFGLFPGAQQFVAAIYKPEGFNGADMEAFDYWHASVQATNNAYVSILHTPGAEYRYDSFFDSHERALLASQFNTTAITDEKPFRHLVTALPFPNYYYSITAVAVGILLLLIHIISIRTQLPMALPIASFGLGVVTFGLQYTLYYKSASYLGADLIFFGAFLVIPLLFGAFGAYVSTTLTRMQLIFLLVISGGAAYLLFMYPISVLSSLGAFCLVAVLFFFSGIIFPKLLSTTSNTADRKVLYAASMFGGGASSIIVITGHASLGWSTLFVSLVVVLLIFTLTLYAPKLKLL